MSARWQAAVATLALVGWAAAVPVTSALAAPAGSAAVPAQEHACAAPAPGTAACGAIQLLYPGRNWHPGPSAHAAGKPGGGGGGSTASLPTSGYYPGDLQAAYGLATAAAAFGPGPNAPTIAIVDAYDDPYAAADLATYRSTLSGVTDANTGLPGPTFPPLCSSTPATGCVTFKKVNQSGGTSYPRGNTGWGEEISVDLDMISAICPDCNITLVEASSASFSNLDAAVSYAQTLSPAAITNSYGGSEFTSETSDNATYSAGTATAITAASGDSGYGVEFPAASPDLTAVGGTSLTYSGFGSTLSWNPQSVWSSAGSGCSTYEAMPTWQNDSSAYYQSSVCTNRQVADVAAVADPNTGVAVYDSYGESGWMVFGGTSVAAQVIGGVYGLAAGSGTIQASPAALYPDATTGGSGATPGLTPVSSGSTSSCGDYLCNAADSLSSGYNGPTGLGTPSGVAAFQQAPLGTLSFSPSSETLTAGGTAGPFTVDLSSSAPSGGTTVTLTTSSSSGSFATSAGGSPSSTLSVTIPGGGTTSADVYYSDTTAGTPTVTAAASGWTSASMTVTVTAGALASITVSPSSVTLAQGATQTFTATGADSYGNPVSVDPSWTFTAPGSLSPTSGSTTTFTASTTSTGTGSVTATSGSVSGSASVSVTAEPAIAVSVTAGSVSKKGHNYKVPLTVDATNAAAGSPVGGASVSLQIYQGSACSGTPAASSSGTTGSNGEVGFTFTTGQKSSWCALAIVSESGYTTGSGQTGFST
ncbi:MAG: hypothetical protein ACYCO3_05985 [Mycobacteriales bacterium]